MKLVEKHIAKSSLVLCLCLVAACSVKTKRNELDNNDDDRPNVSEEYKIKSDRQKLDELRKDIPDDKREENDELAVLVGMMGQVKKHPSDVREDFNKITRKKREAFQKEQTKSREKYSNTERKNREKFLADLQKERDNFLKQKGKSADEKREFFANQDDKRKEYFGNERDARQEFESNARDRCKNFEDYMREKTNEFNQEHRAYSKTWEEKIKVEKEKKKQKEQAMSGGTNQSGGGQYAVPNDANNFLDNPYFGGTQQPSPQQNEFDQIPSKPATPLGSGQ